MLTRRQLALGVGGTIIGAALWLVLVVDFFGIMPVRKPFRNYYPIPSIRHEVSTNMVVGQWEGATFGGTHYAELNLNADGTAWVVEQSTGSSYTNATLGRWWLGVGHGYEGQVRVTGDDKQSGFIGYVSLDTIRREGSEVAKVIFLTCPSIGATFWYILLRSDHIGRLRSAAHELESEMSEGTVHP